MNGNCQNQVNVNIQYLNTNKGNLDDTYALGTPMAIELSTQEKDMEIRINEKFNQLLSGNEFCPGDNYRIAQIALIDISADDMDNINKSPLAQECIVKSLFSRKNFYGRIIGIIPLNIFSVNYKNGVMYNNAPEYDLSYYTPDAKRNKLYSGMKRRRALDMLPLPFTVKTSFIPNDITIKNEAVIGYYINSLRVNIPNFVYTLGVTECSTDANKLCIAPGSNPHVIVEKSDLNLTQYLKRPDVGFDQWLEIFIQILIAYEYIDPIFEFTHYNLITDNISILYPDEDIQYKVNNLYVQGKCLARIDSLNYARIKIRTDTYGIYDPKSFIFADNAFPMYDIYSLVVSSAKVFFDQDKISDLNKINNIYRYFNQDNDIRYFINTFIYDPTILYSNFADISKFSLGQFINCIRQNYSNVYNNVVLSTQSDNMMILSNMDSPTQILAETAGSISKISNFEQGLYAYDTDNSDRNINSLLYKYIIDEWIDSDLESEITNFNRQNRNLERNINNFNSDYDESILLTEDSPGSNDQQIISKFSDINNITAIISKLNEVLRLIEIVQNMNQRFLHFTEFNRLVNRLYPDFNDPKYAEDIAEYVERLPKYSQKIAKLQNKIGYNRKIIYNQYLKLPELSTKISKLVQILNNFADRIFNRVENDIYYDNFVMRYKYLIDLLQTINNIIKEVI